MKIRIFIGSLSGGGAERVACNLSNYLVHKGNNVEVITMVDEEATYFLDDVVSRVPLIGGDERKGKVYDFLIRIWRLYKCVKYEAADCYIVMLPITTILLLLLEPVIKAPVIVSERCDAASYSTIKQLCLKALAKRADGFVFQTNEARDWYQGKTGKAIFEVIPNAINSEFLKPEYDGVRKKEIISAGRITKQKNFSLLLKAFSKIHDKHPEYYLKIYGEGKDKHLLMKQSEDMGLSSKVVFPGYVSNLADEMEAASLFVLSSDYEGMPNALIEAMALGLPCISTNCPCGGPRYLINNGENGLLVSVNNVDELACTMDTVLRDETYAKQLGNNAANIKMRLAPEIIYDQWENFIIRVCEKGRRK